MESVLVDKTDLLNKVKTNRDSHRAIFEEALDGYKAKVLEILDGHIERVKNNKPERVVVSIPFPEDHTEDYDVIIGMLEMSIDKDIELTQYDFSSYVLDNWAWKKQFLTSNSYYSATANTMLLASS